MNFTVEEEKAMRVLTRGAEVDQQTLLNAANRGQPGVAELLMGATAMKVDWAGLAERARRQAQDADTARRIAAGKLTTNERCV